MKFLKSLKRSNQIGITRSEAIKIELGTFPWNKRKLRKNRKWKKYLQIMDRTSVPKKTN
jgi:hypothetical protein